MYQLVFRMVILVTHFGFRHISQEMYGESFHLEILKEALLKTIADIDTIFSRVVSFISIQVS